MKRFTLVIAIVLMVAFVAPLAAEDFTPNNPLYKQTGDAFVGTSVRVLGMGGASLGVKGYHDSFLFNPANIVKSGFKFSLPSVTVTAFNPKAILESGAIEDFQSGTDAGMASGAQKFLGTITKGQGDILTTDVSTTLTLGSFGLNVQVQERLITYKPGTDLTGTYLIAQVTTAATAGFGFRINIAKSLSIDLGVSAQAVYKTYLKAVTGSTFMTSFMSDDSDIEKTFLSETPFMAGFALPISAGINVNLPLGLRVSAAAKNINGNYKMTEYVSVNDWAEEVLGQRISEDGETSQGPQNEWTVEKPWRLDAGLSWALDIPVVKPTIAFDVIDVMAMQGKTGDDLKRAFLEQTRLGASVRLLSILDFRYGLNQGYQSIGVGFDLLIFHIDAAYYTQEYGPNIEDKPLDAFSLRFSLFSR